MLKHLAAAAFLVFGCPEHGSAQTIDRSVPGHPYPVSPARHSADGPTSHDPDPRDPARQRALLSEISDWLSREFGLPQSAKYPKLAFATPSELVRRRYRIIRSDTKLSSYEASAQSTVARTVAIYDDSEATIYLAQDWSGASAADVSVLVHEMVHHLQNVGHMHFECARAREATAYEAQERWLQIHGGSLAADFEIDPFTVLVNSSCIF